MNPFASCLPLLAQLPVFISLFYLLQDDLRYEICGQTARPCGESAVRRRRRRVPVHPGHHRQRDRRGPHRADRALRRHAAARRALLMTVSADKNQRMIFLALPFIFIPFVINFPAGLLVYWITTNLWTIVQQFIVRRTVGPVQPPADGRPASAAGRQASGGKPAPARTADDRQAAAHGRRGGTRRAAHAPAPPAAAVASARRSAPGGAADGRAHRRRGRCSELLERVADALDLDADGRRSTDDGETADRRASRARTWACSSATTARRSRPSSTWPSGRRRGETRGGERRRVVVDAAGYRERRERRPAAPGRRGRRQRARAPAARSRSTR